MFICDCICICISLIWKYAVGGRRGGVDFVSLSLSSSPPLQLFRRRRPVATLCIMYLCIFCLYFSPFFFCQDSHFPRYPGILSALTLFFMHQHTSPREGLPYPPLPASIMNLFLIYFRCICGFVPHLCGEMQSVEK